VVVVDLSMVMGEPELLDDGERARAGRFRTDDLARTFIAAHTALRRVLGWFTGQDPGRLGFDHTPAGKPSLTDRAAAFNLSHSGTHALIAVATSGRLGVDVEHDTRDLDPHLAQRLLAPQETAVFARLPPAARPAALLRTWTRKEAVLKAIGLGLPAGMEHVVLDAPPGVTPRLVGDFTALPGASGLAVHDLPLPAPLVGAWCGDQTMGVATLWRWPADSAAAR
jgi:4'-phosphopantetheinyl transferase